MEMGWYKGMKHEENAKEKISDTLKGNKRDEETINKISAGMQGKNSGAQNPKYIGTFFMIDTETGQKRLFSSTHECSKFARNELKLPLVHSTVLAKLNGKSKSLYREQYRFEWCRESCKQSSN
jgi:hypothetical protein